MFHCHLVQLFLLKGHIINKGDGSSVSETLKVWLCSPTLLHLAHVQSYDNSEI